MELSEIAKYAGLCGFPGDHDENKIAIATAIAMAESKGNPSAHNYNVNSGDDSYGLWQINMLGPLGPSRRQQFEINDNSALLDPCVNAKAMSIVSGEGTNWQPWTMYTNGEYKKYLESAKKVANVGGSTNEIPIGERVSDIASNPLGAFNVLIDPLLKVSQGILDGFVWIGNPRNWTRAIQVGGGITLAIVAISIIVKPVIEDKIGKLPL